MRSKKKKKEIYMNSLHEVKDYDLSFQLSTVYLESTFRIPRDIAISKTTVYKLFTANAIVSV